MLKFAVSETEHGLGNNATGQFCRLYHYLLSGTQAPPEMRLAVIDRGLDTDDPDYQRICIIALGHALKTQHFHRIGGVETQGCRYPHEDWQPTIYKELFDYWDGALQRLERYSVKDDELGDLARKQIQDSIIGMLRYGRLDTLEKIILSICDKRGIFWPEAQYDMKWFLSNYNDKIPAEGKERINELIKKLEPKNTKEKIYVTIIRPGLTVRFEGEDWHEKRIGNVEELARELAKNPNELLEALNILYQTQAVYGRHFGYTLGKYYEDKLKFINNSLTLLESIPKELRNETILGGFLFALRPNNPELIKYCLENIGDNPNLEDLLIPLTSYSQPDKADLERLLAPLKSGKLCIDDFKTFQYSAVLSHLSPSIVTSFLADILSISPEGCSVVLDIIYTYTFKDTAKLQECIPFIKNMLIEKRCFYYSIKTSPTHYNLYTIDEITVSLLQADKNNEDLVEKFTKELVSLCSEGLNTHGIADNLQDLLELLISPDYINLTWPIFGKAIVEDETSDIAYCLMDLLGNKFSLGDGKKSILESIPIQITSRWCEENPEHAPNFLSLAISPLTEEDGCVCWSPYAVYLLDNFGTSEHILSNLSRNIHTFPWRGSLVPAYEKRL
ncbi:MAG: hypothetical protein QCI00_09480, partial [Candidatus Thermoplasmatota archaeon]|nr:hypothetical protein [Candidatus Thermoplasmatota archaeon]